MAGFAAGRPSDMANMADITSCLMSLNCLVSVAGILHVVRSASDYDGAEEDMTSR